MFQSHGAYGNRKYTIHVGKYANPMDPSWVFYVLGLTSTKLSGFDIPIPRCWMFLSCLRASSYRTGQRKDRDVLSLDLLSLAHICYS